MHERNDKWSVGEWMTPHPETVEPNTSVRSAFFRMRSEGVRHLPVVEARRIAGMISIGDLTRWMIREQQYEIGDLVGYIAGA